MFHVVLATKKSLESNGNLAKFLIKLAKLQGGNFLVRGGGLNHFFVVKLQALLRA